MILVLAPKILVLVQNRHFYKMEPKLYQNGTKSFGVGTLQILALEISIGVGSVLAPHSLWVCASLKNAFQILLTFSELFFNT